MVEKPFHVKGPILAFLRRKSRLIGVSELDTVQSASARLKDVDAKILPLVVVVAKVADVQMARVIRGQIFPIPVGRPYYFQFLLQFAICICAV